MKKTPNPCEVMLKEIKDLINKRMDDLEAKLIESSKAGGRTGGLELASEITGYSIPTLKKMASTGKIPKASAKGEKIRFEEKTLKEWMRNRGKGLTEDELDKEIEAEFSKFKTRKR